MTPSPRAIWSTRAACRNTSARAACPRATRWPSSSGRAVRKTPTSSSIRRRATRTRPARGARASCSTTRPRATLPTWATASSPCSLPTGSTASPCATIPRRGSTAMCSFGALVLGFVIYSFIAFGFTRRLTRRVTRLSEAVERGGRAQPDHPRHGYGRDRAAGGRASTPCATRSWSARATSRPPGRPTATSSLPCRTTSATPSRRSSAISTCSR